MGKKDVGSLAAMDTRVCVLRDMAPGDVREMLLRFTPSYVNDWNNWLRVDESDRVARFAAILRSWQGTRPLPMRRPRAEASHKPPFIEDLLEAASPHLKTLSDLTVADLATASPEQIEALHGLWAVFSNLPQRGSASCVGITKAILLLTHGQIGPAFDSIARRRLGLKKRVTSSQEWIDVLRRVSEDIGAFEKRHGKLTGIVPESFAKYRVGRLYDMVLGPGTSDTGTLPDPEPNQVAIGPYESGFATCDDHDPRATQVAALVTDLIISRLSDVAVEHVGSTAVPGCAGKGVVDLMTLYRPGQLAAVRGGLDALGFQRQTGRDPFPEERPMRIGSVDYEGSRFRLHVHVIADDSPEVAEFRAFRDRLRGDPLVLKQYVALKRKMVKDGVTDSLEYSMRKGEFIAGVLRHGSIEKVGIREKLALFNDHWNPRIVGELNGQHVKLVKFQGEFVWHKHDHEDEMFLVVHGRFRMEFRDRHGWVEEGQFVIVPRGVEHRPVAEEEVHVLLFEPAGTLNTGDVRDARTVEDPERI
jgi:GrpB-like predicted nucleotidyltransferase (UPF0157 family)/mannose-6-phosphate isomerase-like protein (cupin superfamily)